MEKYKCACCDCYTLNEKPPGTHEVCYSCSWQEDEVQETDPTFEGGGNGVSLNTARENYLKIGVSDERFTLENMQRIMEEVRNHKSFR